MSLSSNSVLLYKHFGPSIPVDGLQNTAEKIVPPPQMHSEVVKAECSLCDVQDDTAWHFPTWAGRTSRSRGIHGDPGTEEYIMKERKE